MSIRKLREACFRWTRCELYHTLNRYMKAKKVLKKESSMAKLMGNSPTLKKFMVGDVVEGSIVAIRENEILLDIGAK